MTKPFTATARVNYYRGWTIRVPRRLSEGAIEAAQRDGCRRAAEDLSATALLRAAEITTKNPTIFVEGSREAVERFAGLRACRPRGCAERANSGIVSA
jgi:hypothetical protein